MKPLPKEFQFKCDEHSLEQCNNHVKSTFVIRTKEDLEQSRCNAYKLVIK